MSSVAHRKVSIYKQSLRKSWELGVERGVVAKRRLPLAPALITVSVIFVSLSLSRGGAATVVRKLRPRIEVL